MSLSEKEKENAMSEIRILASLQSPNVIAYKECFIDNNSSSLWFYLIRLYFIFFPAW